MLHFAAKLNILNFLLMNIFFCAKDHFCFCNSGREIWGCLETGYTCIYVRGIQFWLTKNWYTNFGFASRIYVLILHDWIDRNESLLPCYSYRSIDGNNGSTPVGVANHVYIHATGITSCSVGASKGMKLNDEHVIKLLRQSGQAVEAIFSWFRKTHDRKS